MGLDNSCCRLAFAPQICVPCHDYYTLLLAYLLQTPPLHSYTPSSRPDQITLANSGLASQLCGWMPGPGPAYYSTPIWTQLQNVFIIPIKYWMCSRVRIRPN